MAFIEIRPGRRYETDGEPLLSEGVFKAGLVEITDPYTFTPQTGFNAGEEQTRISWVFAVESDDDDDGKLIEQRTSTATGPRSGINTILTALFGGKAPPIGTKLEKDQLIGRSLQLTTARNGEYLNITNIAPILSGKTKAAVIDQAVGDGTGNFTDLPC